MLWNFHSHLFIGTILHLIFLNFIGQFLHSNCASSLINSFNSCNSIWIRLGGDQLINFPIGFPSSLHLWTSPSCCRAIGQLTMQGPGFGLDQPLPPPPVPPPRTPPCPPGLSRLGTSTLEQATSKAWRWCNRTTENFSDCCFCRLGGRT